MSTETARPVRPARPATPAPGRRRLPLLLLLATVAAFALRLALAWPMDGPIVSPDEIGYLGQARWLVGDDSTRMTGATYYNIGYPLLLLPAALLGGDDPDRFWRLLLVTNAAIGASLVPLLTALLRRTLSAGRTTAVVAAFVASCAPGFVLPAGQGWGEIAVAPAFLLWLLAMSELFRRPTVLSGALSGTAAAFTWAVHARAGLPALAATALVALVALGTRRLPARALAGVGAAAAVSVVALATLQGRAEAALWGDSRSLTDRTARGLLDPASVEPLTAQLTGTLWNALVGSVGIAGLGVAALVLAAWRADRPGSGPARATAATALLGAVGVWVAAAVFFIPASRADQFLHGRYIEAVLPLPLAAGVVVLARARSWRRLLAAGALTGAVMLVCALVVRLIRGDLLESALFYPFSTSGVMLFSLDPERAQLATATATALATGAAVLAVTAVRRWAGVVAAAAVLLVSTGYTADQVYWPLNEGRYAGWTAPPDLPGTEEIAVSREPGMWFEGRAYHFWMPGVRIVPVDLALSPRPDYRYVLAPITWPGGERAGVRRVWVNNHGTVALFDQGSGTTAEVERVGDNAADRPTTGLWP